MKNQYVLVTSACLYPLSSPTILDIKGPFDSEEEATEYSKTMPEVPYSGSGRPTMSHDVFPLTATTEA